jgi:DNA-binding winged helix-turn-helix (wHTH) protein
MSGCAWRAARFGPFEADATSFALFKRGTRVKLQELPLRILFLLLQEPDHLVTRAELKRALWPVDTFVDFERGLNVAMSKLREALGESAASPTYIETIPKQGYRFIGEIEYLAAEKPPERDPAPLRVMPPVRPAVHGNAAPAPEAAPAKLESIPALIVIPQRKRIWAGRRAGGGSEGPGRYSRPPCWDG